MDLLLLPVHLTEATHITWLIFTRYVCEKMSSSTNQCRQWTAWVFNNSQICHFNFVSWFKQGECYPLIIQGAAANITNSKLVDALDMQKLIRGILNHPLWLRWRWQRQRLWSWSSLSSVSSWNGKWASIMIMKMVMMTMMMIIIVITIISIIMKW